MALQLVRREFYLETQFKLFEPTYEMQVCILLHHYITHIWTTFWQLSKSKTHPITFQENFLKIQNNFPDHHHIYTDGSKKGMKLGCAAVFQNQELLKRLPNESSIYSAEVIAIDLANHKSSKFIIYSDSKSVLQALLSKNSSCPLITRLLDKMNTLSKNNSIILTWIPNHIGIQRNERADRAAKKVLQIRISNTKIPYTDLKPLINKFIFKKWQKSWDDQIQNKLHHIQDTIGEWPVGYRRNRKEVIISRPLISHTHITHSHLLKGEDSPVCPTCKVPLTVKHILINCDRFRQICPKYYQTNNLKNLFKNSKPE